MKPPFNIKLPADLSRPAKAGLLTWRIIQRLAGFIIMPIVAFLSALNYAWDQDSIRDFPDNFWRCFSRVTWLCWHLCAGYDTAAYYQLYEPSGSCGPWTWFSKRPEDPKDGRHWRATNGYSYGGRL